ncbi:unnamed protein product [Ectocarpus sp. CCAP 1310/34]|nr:unnamed protein product [Ectocarpus sp. CCAP 1310/34]
MMDRPPFFCNRRTSLLQPWLSVWRLSVCLRALNTQQTRAHFTISAPNCKLKLAHNK